LQKGGFLEQELYGFFVKSGEVFAGPFLRLKEARDFANRIKPGLEVYHGTLKSPQDKSDLDLIHSPN
jgi:hypothetical protein